MPYEEAQQDEQRVKAGKCKQFLLDSSMLRWGVLIAQELLYYQAK